MASNTVDQNPRNKVGRYSGGGNAGITEVIPTPQEAAHGLRSFHINEESNWMRNVGLGAAALLGAGVAAVAVQRARQPRTLRARMKHMVGLH